VDVKVFHLPEDPTVFRSYLVVPGSGKFSNKNNFLFGFPIIKYKTGFNRRLKRAFITAFVSFVS
jgi:hypothetical protein